MNQKLEQFKHTDQSCASSSLVDKNGAQMNTPKMQKNEKASKSVLETSHQLQKSPSKLKDNERKTSKLAVEAANNLQKNSSKLDSSLAKKVLTTNNLEKKIIF